MMQKLELLIAARDLVYSIGQTLRLGRERERWPREVPRPDGWHQNRTSLRSLQWKR